MPKSIGINKLKKEAYKKQGIREEPCNDKVLKSSYSVMNIHCILFTFSYTCCLFKNNLYNF